MWFEPKQQHLCSRRRTPGEASPWTAPSKQHRHVGLALENLSLHFGGYEVFLQFGGHCHITTLAPTGATSSTGGLEAGQPWPGDTFGLCPCKESGAKFLICVIAQVSASLGSIRTHTHGSTDTGKTYRDPSRSLQPMVTLNLQQSRGKCRLFLPV